jgi:acyl-CoA reductase-like NAD-dependent aldehyde dehydrogenase
MKIKLMIVLGVTALAFTLVLTTIAPAANNSMRNAVPAVSAQLFAAEASPAERHPHIRSALHELREARGELKTAAHDFGGHRDEAVEAVDKAIRQLEECLKYDKD